ncbi:MAG: arginine--tRNA ligase [Planctomycetota bacterium]
MTTTPANATTEQPHAIDPVQILSARFRAAIAAVAPEAAGNADPMITPSKRKELGDFQSNAAMPLAKRTKQNPREFAAKLVEALDVADICEPVTDADIAGPGFINVRLRTDMLASLVSRLDSPELGLPKTATPETVVVDVCGVNLAKQMHVGHLRATVIGDTLARTFERLGHKAIRQNHVGDWGLPIAMVTAKLRTEAAAGRVDMDALDLDTLDRLYKLAQKECKGQASAIGVAKKFGSSPKLLAELEAEQVIADEHMAAAKATLVALQSGDAETVAVWQRIYDTTMTACLAACARLHTRITDEASAGESSYRDELADVVDDLVKRDVAQKSDGALVVRLDAAGIAEPCLIRKRDGGFLYATTDIAGIRRRVQKLGADRVVYCVDARQSLHFRQVFEAARIAGYATKPDAEESSALEHAAFGMVMGEDGKPYKTRSGENVKLSALLDEAVASAERAVREKDPGVDDDRAARTAEAVGIAAIKYADLSGERAKDYVFSFERMLSFEGNTGPYLLYAPVRVGSIFRKAEERGVALDHADAALLLREPQEKALALALLRYPTAVRNVAAQLEPYRLCAQLYDIATAFSSFYDACPVLTADDDETRRSRMRLADITRRVLIDGLETLGIPTLERM